MVVTRFDTEYVQLKDWVTVEDAATMLRISSARVRQLILDHRFKKIAQVGQRPLNLLARREVEAMVKAQQGR